MVRPVACISRSIAVFLRSMARKPNAICCSGRKAPAKQDRGRSKLFFALIAADEVRGTGLATTAGAQGRLVLVEYVLRHEVVGAVHHDAVGRKGADEDVVRLDHLREIGELALNPFAPGVRVRQNADIDPGEQRAAVRLQLVGNRLRVAGGVLQPQRAVAVIVDADGDAVERRRMRSGSSTSTTCVTGATSPCRRRCTPRP